MNIDAYVLEPYAGMLHTAEYFRRVDHVVAANYGHRSVLSRARGLYPPQSVHTARSVGVDLLSAQHRTVYTVSLRRLSRMHPAHAIWAHDLSGLLRPAPSAGRHIWGPTRHTIMLGPKRKIASLWP